MADGFLSRWSRRKAGKEEDALENKVETSSEAPTTLPLESPPEDTPPPPTLEDVDKIDRFAPDFSAFMKPDVDPAVQQAALKKMFTDPHFNIMDGLDIYIDDYSKPDPLPPGMLERMVQSDMLNLFRKPGEEESQDAQQSVGQPPGPQLEGESLEAQMQSDLTSTQHIGAARAPDPLDEVSPEAPVGQEQKKT
ncbi:DUF3306 domain-containing protein [Polynucleobacter sp. AP-Kolm-20A-A1]|uniref:DUF3306 domain-containing protein n=1 Tax=Polynucleobacter sp. AP-Kolm-20A-A1 TaxID=2081041 RepID=UPI00203DCF2B|nr:DUF3306 domain-containing protein [Polynucleobacter sp. AP-Kolm-20A-A1]